EILLHLRIRLAGDLLGVGDHLRRGEGLCQAESAHDHDDEKVSKLAHSLAFQDKRGTIPADRSIHSSAFVCVSSCPLWLKPFYPLAPLCTSTVVQVLSSA